MITRKTAFLFWLALFLVVGARAMPNASAPAVGIRCMSNLASCEQLRERRALYPEITAATRHGTE